MTAVALIVHARGAPESLDLCLAALYGQRLSEFEILVTNTGRSRGHDEVLRHHQAHMRRRLRTVQVPATSSANGGNLAHALNAALLDTDAEYLVFLGGDCLAQPDFVSAHVAAADYGYFAHAETLPLDAKISGAIDARALGSGLAFDEQWLQATSPGWHGRHLAPSAIGALKAWLKKDTPDERYFNVDSSSCFREEFLAINGFDRDVDDWRLERDMANRLQNNGQEPIAVGPAGNVLRLHGEHPEREAPSGGRLPATLAPGGEVRAVNGLEELRAGAARASA